MTDAPTSTHKTTHPGKAGFARVIAFVDESGDRNCGQDRQSDHFSMTAVVVAQEHEDALRAVILGHRALWRVTGQLHWVKHLKPRRHGRRELLVGALARLPGIRVIHVVVDKPALLDEATFRHDQASFYNWVAKLLLERIGEVAATWDGGERLARVYFGLVGGVDSAATDAYLNAAALAAVDPRDAGLRDNIEWPLKFQPTSSRDGLQAADQYSGILATAINHDDDRWFEMVRHQLHQRHGDVVGGGIKIFPPGSSLFARSWCTHR